MERINMEYSGFRQGGAGVGSLFKKISEDPVADVGTILDKIEGEGKSFDGANAKNY